MVNEIKNLRVKIDGLAQLTKELKPIEGIEWYCEEHLGAFREGKDRGVVFPTKDKLYNSKEIEKSVDSLYLAKAWLGKCLGELDVPTPYKNDGKRKTVEDIEPTADVDKGMNTLVGYNHLVFIHNWEKKSHIEKVDWLRQEIQKLYKEAELFIHKEPNKMVNIIGFQQHLSEARFWLGFELQRIKENKMK